MRSEIQHNENIIQPRLAMYISSMNRGGAEHVMTNLAEHFVGLGWDIRLVTTHRAQNEYSLCGRESSEYSADERTSPEGIVCVTVQEGTPDRPGRLVRYYSEIGPEEETGSRLHNFRARCAKLTIIWKMTDPDAVLSCIGKNNMMAVKTASRLGIPTAVSVRADPQMEYPSFFMKAAAGYYYRKAAAVIMQTDSTLAFFGNSTARKAVVLKNPVGDRYLTEKLCDINDREKTIIAVGRNDANKRHEMLVNAFAAVSVNIPDYRLVIYGDGELHERLRERVRQLGMEKRISLPGVTDDAAGAMGRASVFVLTSDTEGMPNSLIEAMCMGMVCISTDCPCGGPHMLIRDGVNGILIPVADQKALEKALLAAASDGEMRIKMSEEAQKMREIYSSERVYGEWEEQLRKIMCRDQARRKK